MNHRLSFKVLAVWGVTKRGTVIARLLLSDGRCHSNLCSSLSQSITLHWTFTAHQLSSIHFARIFLGIALHRCGDVGWRRDLWADHHITSKEREHAVPLRCLQQPVLYMLRPSLRQQPPCQQRLKNPSQLPKERWCQFPWQSESLSWCLMMSDDLFQWLWWQFSLEFAEIALQL